MKARHLGCIGCLATLLLAGCSVAQRLSEIGQPPRLTPIENPVREPGYRPVSLPMPDPEPLQSAGVTCSGHHGDSLATIRHFGVFD